MNVAVMAAENAYNKKMLDALRAKLPEVTLLPWKSGDKAPADNVEVLLAMGAVMREDMEALPGLALLQTLSDGYDSVDVKAATELGIWVSNGPAEITGNGDSVAEFAVLLLLATARRLGVALASTRDAGAEKPADTVALLGKTVLIVGLGSIGSRIAELLTGFGVRLIGVDRLPLMAPRSIPTRPLDELDAALAEADFVVLCIRGTDENEHMFDAKRMQAMKAGAVLVNIARGSLVDEKALFDAVKGGHLAGAGLDVLEHEPVVPANPLLTLPQVFLTPHQAGLTDLMIKGTAEYVRYVLGEFATGREVKSMLNAPVKARRGLQGK